MGDNPKSELFDDIALILRDSAHIERFTRNLARPPIRKPETPGELMTASRKATRNIVNELAETLRVKKEKGLI
jgi:hypothetical protein